MEIEKVWLVTGGTGSFGRAFVKKLLCVWKPSKVIIFSRDEMKQWDMAKEFQDDSRVRFFLGDVRDKDRLYRALNGVDFVVHAAAYKIVPLAEYNPFECVKTNIIGAMNLIDAALDNQVLKVVALSTDKASAPSNLYGATKLASDKLFTAANAYSGHPGTSFSVVRYGNVMGSRGSVIPLFIEMVKTGKLTITDKRMTRFMIELKDGVDLVFRAFKEPSGGNIFVKKIPSMNIMDIANSIGHDVEIEYIGVRPGEKLHEQMVSIDDAQNTIEFDDYFVINSSINRWDDKEIKKRGGERVPDGFRYTSDENENWMTSEELSSWIAKNKSKLGKI